MRVGALVYPLDLILNPRFVIRTVFFPKKIRQTLPL